MPLFKYACLACQAEHEFLVRGSECPVCPDCGSKRLEKQMSAFAPMSGSRPEPVGCGASQCCQLNGSPCMN